MEYFDSNTQILHGEQQPLIFHPNASIGEVLLDVLRKTPTKITQVCADDGVEISCGEMADMMVAIARNLMKRGFKLGDVVGVIGKNVTYSTPTIFGCYLLGCPTSPLDSDLTVDEIASVYRQTRPKIVFCDSYVAAKVKDAVKLLGQKIEIVTLTIQIKGYLHISEFLKDPGNEYKIPPNAFQASKHCATIMRTTGTTEDPKIAKVSHAQLLHPLTIYSNDEDVFGFSFSLYSWITCTFLTVSAVIKQEKRLITSSPFDAEVFFNFLEKFKFSHFVTAPGHYRLLMQSPRYETVDFSSLKCLAVGGWHVPEELRKVMQMKIPTARIVVGGGMTEIGGGLFQIDPKDPISAAVGKPIPNTQVKILMDDGSFGGFDDIGEVLVKRPDRFLGYIHNDKATAETVDVQGWLHTGDVGYFDETLNVTFIGRTAFMIRCGKNFFQPLEVEDLIGEIPGIKDVCVVGVAEKSSQELPTAMILKDIRSEVTEEMVNDSIKHLEDFKQLKGGIFFVDEIALTISGKVKRNIMKEIATKMYAEKSERERNEKDR